MSRLKLRILAAAMVAVSAPATVVLAPAAQAGVHGSTSQINLDEHGVALGGYDPVAYFVSGKPTHGRATISATYQGARYRFASTAHRRTFLRNPKRYVPEFGGFCVVGTSFGEKVDVDPETGTVVNGKLYLNNSRRAADLFDKDRAGVIAKAGQNWPTVKDKVF